MTPAPTPPPTPRSSTDPGASTVPTALPTDQLPASGAATSTPPDGSGAATEPPLAGSSAATTGPTSTNGAAQPASSSADAIPVVGLVVLLGAFVIAVGLGLRRRRGAA
jgi:hypothetical protein